MEFGDLFGSWNLEGTPHHVTWSRNLFWYHRAEAYQTLIYVQLLHTCNSMHILRKATQ